MTIKQKIVGKSLGSAVLLAAVGLLSALSMHRIGTILRTDVAIELRETFDADGLQRVAADIERTAQNYVTASQEHRPADATRMRAEVTALFDEARELTSRLDQTIEPQPADLVANSPDNQEVLERHQLELIEHQLQISGNGWSKLQSQIDGNGDGRIDSASLNRVIVGVHAVPSSSQELERLTKTEITRALQAAQDRVTTSVRFLIGAAVLAILLSLSLGLLVAMPLAARLGQLRDGAVRIGQGDLEARINKITSGDEIGQLATAFNEMANRLQHSRAEIKESESNFRQLAETVREVFWVCDPAGTKVHYISPAYVEVWGRSCESLYQDARSFAEAIVPEDRARVLDALEKMATSQFDEEYRITRPDGAVRWIHARAFAVGSETGEVQRVVGIATDVTKQRTAEDALRTAHAELENRVETRTAELKTVNEALERSKTDLQRAKDAAEAAARAMSVVFDMALDAIVTIDSRGLITEWNLQAETMFRWDRTEVVGLRLDQTIIPEPEWDAHRRAIETFLQTGEGRVFNTVAELVARRRDGREFPVEVAITPGGTGKECTFTAFIRDISQRKKAEVDLCQARDAAENASRAKSEFLANMSHEIRTPLNGVIGMSGLLLDTALDERQRRFAELIRSSGASLADLINDILDFSKIEARKLEIEAVDFDLYAAVEDVSEMMSMKATQKGLDLACLTLPDVPRQVKGDAQRVKQILINLINNAIKFTEAGSVSLRLTLEEQSPEHAIVRFSVSDTGIGIPADRMDRLFKSFSQVDASTTRTYGGTGLGLAISKQLAELMGGSIGVDSTPGCGSTFWFTVRLGIVSPIREPVPNPAINLGGLRVLAVHHDPTMGEILRSQLCSWGMQVALTTSGNSAVNLLADALANSRPFEVAILDSELPNNNALDLGLEIKGRADISGTILLILLPANSDLEPLKLKAAGFSGHLVKPVRQSRLYDTIVDAIASTSSSKQAVAEILTIGKSPGSPPAMTSQQARILIAEDNRVNQIVASEVLAKHGYACDIVDNGRKAVAATLTGHYDLVLMDCLMPELDGFEATRQIRQLERDNPATPPRHMPIIALTANAINGDRQRCLEAGMDDYVSKPLDPDRLIKAMQTVLAKFNSPSTIQGAASVSELPPSEAAPVAAAAPPAVIRNDIPPLAVDALLERCMGNVETVALILNEFERQAVSDLAEIKRHVGGRDCTGLARVAHALKGASGVLAADTLSDIAFKLERMGRTGVLADEDQLLTQLDDEVRRCISYLPTARMAIAGKTKV